MEKRHDPPNRGNVKVTFDVTPARQCVAWHVTVGPRTFSPPVRSATAMLLVLARKRLADLDLGLSENECGWLETDQLALDLAGGNVALLNLWVFRVRRAFAAIGSFTPARIVERRPLTRKLRIATSHIEIRLLRT